jgi:hypothetical protein
MSDECGEFLRYEEWCEHAPDAVRDAEWQTHVKDCGACRAQRAAHEQLTALFAAEPSPVLRADVAARVVSQITPAPAAAPSRAARFGIAVYWILAAAASAGIVAGIEWPRSFWWSPGFVCAVLFGAGMIPFVYALAGRRVPRVFASLEPLMR